MYRFINFPYVYWLFKFSSLNPNHIRRNNVQLSGGKNGISRDGRPREN